MRVIPFEANGPRQAAEDFAVTSPGTPGPGIEALAGCAICGAAPVVAVATFGPVCDRCLGGVDVRPFDGSDDRPSD